MRRLAVVWSKLSGRRSSSTRQPVSARLPRSSKEVNRKSIAAYTMVKPSPTSSLSPQTSHPKISTPGVTVAMLSMLIMVITDNDLYLVAVRLTATTNKRKVRSAVSGTARLLVAFSNCMGQVFCFLVDCPCGRRLPVKHDRKWVKGVNAPAAAADDDDDDDDDSGDSYHHDVYRDVSRCHTMMHY